MGLFKLNTVDDVYSLKEDKNKFLLTPAPNRFVLTEIDFIPLPLRFTCDFTTILCDTTMITCDAE